MPGQQLGLFIDYVCDGHQERDALGPLMTIVEGLWAYCAGNGIADHRWRRIPPTARASFEQTGDADATEAERDARS